MLLKLFFGFTLIPIIELYILIKIGTVIGGFNTILLVLLTGFAGAWLARLEGMNTMIRFRENMQQGIMPAEELIDAAIIFIAGVLLITPGLMTDVSGLLLLWPLTRNMFKRYLRKKFDEMQLRGSIHIDRFPKAMAQAFREGNLGIMDYYKMKNIQADTEMRGSISKPSTKGKK